MENYWQSIKKIEKRFYNLFKTLHFLLRQFTENLQKSISLIKSKNSNFQPGLAIVQVNEKI
jgi:hypothetical protein